MMNLYVLGKKGQAPKNIIIAIIVLFSFGLLITIGALITTAILDLYQSNFSSNADILNAIGGFRSALLVFDYITVFLMFSLIVGIGVTSFKLATRPVFFVVMFVMAAFIGFVGFLFDFIFIQFISNPVFLSITVIFPKTILICSNLEWVALAMIVVGSITLYAKKQEGQFLP